MVRYKNRYLTAEIVLADSTSQLLKLHKAELMAAVLHVTQQIHGEFGAAAIMNGLSVAYCDESTQTAVIRCRHGPHRLLASSLPFLNKIGKKQVQLQSVYTGATMVKCFKFLKKFHQEKISEALKTCKTEEERKKVIEIMPKSKFEM